MIIVIILQLMCLSFIIIGAFTKPRKKVIKDERGWYLKESSYHKSMLILRDKEKNYGLPITKEEEERIQSWLKHSKK